MKKVTGKRVLAFVIDYIIVALIASLFAKVSILNPNYDKYMEEYNKYVDSLKESLSDDSTENVYNNSYEMTKLGVNMTLITIVVGAVYYIGFQYINKGQTIGKKLFKIKMVDENNERPKFYQVLIHSGLIDSLFISLISALSIIYMSKNTYLKIDQVLQILDMAILFGSLGCMIVRKDGKGLHNMLAKTNVVGE